MAAFIPNRREPEITENALRKVREDKLREANDGFDGTWVAHPDLVPVAMEVFDDTLGVRPNQVDRQRDDVDVSARDLLDFHVPDADVTDAGVRTNISVGIRYIASWLNGVGAAAIDNLMEDAATAEISRSQIWQWVRHGDISEAQVNGVEEEEMSALRGQIGEDAWRAQRWEDARGLFERVALDRDFVEFLTLPAYELID
jgi:malate synthase